MSRFEYILPSKTVVSPLHEHDQMTRDRWQITLDGVKLAEVDFQTARLYWLQQITLAEILQEPQKRPPEMI